MLKQDGVGDIATCRRNKCQSAPVEFVMHNEQDFGGLSMSDRIDIISAKFEQALREDKQPRIESFLSEIADPERLILLQKLLALELAHCHRNGETTNLVGYSKRFPKYAQILSDVFANVGATKTMDAAMDLVPESQFQTGDKLPTARSLGQYELLAQLGFGGMGTVFKAIHLSLKRVVALKILPADRMKDAEAVQRFRREMEAVGRLDHPNIVRATDAGDIDGVHFLVMEHVDGIDLSDLILRHGPLAVPDACKIIQQAAAGLQHVHEHGLVHRDIKPSNLMVTVDGQVKLLDLGLALLANDRTTRQELTSSGQILGTVDYMAPEQANNVRNVDIRADLYSLGCTFYKLLTGHAPFSSTKYVTVFQRIRAHVDDPTPSLREQRMDISVALAVISERLLAKNPAERYESPDELVAAITPFTVGSNLTSLYMKVASQSTDEVHPSVPHVSTANSISSALASTQVGHRAQYFDEDQLETSVIVETPPDRRLRLVIAILLLLLACVGVVAFFSNGRGLDEGAVDGEVASNDMEQTTLRLATPQKQGTKSNTGTVPQTTILSDQTTAEWVLSVGGTFTSDKGEVTDVVQMPDQPFQVRAIDLSYNSRVIDDELNNLGGLKNLTRLELTNTKLGDGALRHIMGLTSLSTLSLEGARVSDEGLKHLKGLTNLTWLYLDLTNVTDAGLEQLRGLKNLRILNLANTKVTAGGIANLKRTLPNCEIIHESLGNSDPERRAALWILDMGGRLNVSGSLRDVSEVSKLPEGRLELHIVDVSGCRRVTDESLEHLKRTGVTFLKLNDTHVSDAGLVHIRRLTNLEHLYVGNTKISDAGLRHFTPLRKLKHLIIDDTKIADSGLEHLKDLTNMDYLDLSGTRITDAGLAHVVRMTKLTHLELKGTSVTDAGLKFLRGLMQLSYLNLEGTGVANAGLQHLNELTKLSYLNLAGTDVSDAGLQHLKGLTNLKSLILIRTKTTAQVKASLKKTLPDCTIIGP